METENIEVKIEPNPLHTVTPLSKYLAMALFILMPFIGGWIGYTYSPEKVVEVERVVVKTATSQIATQARVKWDIGEDIDGNFNHAIVTLTLPSGEIKTTHTRVRNDCQELNEQNLNDEWIKKVNAGAIFEKELNLVKPGLACVNRDGFAWYGVFFEDQKYYIKQLTESMKGPGEEQWEIIGEIAAGFESEIKNDQNDTKESNSKPLLSTIRVENDTAEIVQMTWSVREEVRSLFPMNDTYVTFSIIPDGMSYEGLDVSGVATIGDGFKLSQTAYEFNPLNYKALTYEAGVVSQLPIEQNKLYQVVATLKYQPSSFTCKPGMGKDCIPVYSEEDLALVEMAKEYMSVSVPTRMK